MPNKSAKKGKAGPQPKLVFASAAITVSDRKKATKWYTDKLGLDITANMNHWVGVGRKSKGAQIHLCQVSELDKKAKLEPGNSGFLLLSSVKLTKLAPLLKGRGVEVTDGPNQQPWGWDMTIKDLDGNEIMIMEG